MNKKLLMQHWENVNCKLVIWENVQSETGGRHKNLVEIPIFS